MIPSESSHSSPPAFPGHVCPAWAGPLLCCPLRRLLESPERLLGPYVAPGMTVLEPGCGMGFFTLPLARMVGPAGRVVAVDVQPRMVEGLRRRARRAGLLPRVEAVSCVDGDLGLSRFAETIDVAFAIHVVHEVRDRTGFFAQVRAALRPGGRMLVLEPKGHVSREELAAELALAEQAGLHLVEKLPIRRDLGALLERPVARTAGTASAGS
jgi:ubiquinone/menaquinone biosynthesis C-methylase UbiE